MRRLLWALWLLGAVPAAGQPREVDLELVLMADSSGSITMAEIRFQRAGYAAALTDPAVLAAIAQTAYGSVALTYVEWGQFDSQDVVVPWTVIDGADSATAFATALMAAPRRAAGRNAIGSALLFGKALIETEDVVGWRRIIDFSADSTGNFNGPAVSDARAEVLAAGITINGLAVACRDCSGDRDSDLGGGGGGGAGLEDQFRDRIIGGPGAFVVTAETRDTFAEAVKRKLILEISGLHGGRSVAQR